MTFVVFTVRHSFSDGGSLLGFLQNPSSLGVFAALREIVSVFVTVRLSSGRSLCYL